jgi:hypothetical protein
MARLGLPTILIFRLLLPCAAETWDIHVQLYRDPNCYEFSDTLVLLDQGCYANMYSNVTKAYSVKAIDFEYPQRIHIQEYQDDCQTPTKVNPKEIESGTCTRFVGSFWGKIELRYRSSSCIGDICSRLAVAVQTFYAKPNCIGLPMQTFYYPAQKECLRWFNGTQTFLFSSDKSGTNISQRDYEGENANRCNSGVRKTYTMLGGHCYPLRIDQPPMSFRWVVDTSARLTSMGSRTALAPLTLLVPLAAFAASSALDLAYRS